VRRARLRGRGALRDRRRVRRRARGGGRVDCISQFIRKDALAIELLAYRSPGASGAPSTRRNQLGLTHLSLYVEDLAAAAQHLVACGGKLLPATHAENDTVELMFVEDRTGFASS